VIRVDAVWLTVQPLDMRLGTEAALARVVGVFGAAHPNHAYLFANRRATQSVNPRRRSKVGARLRSSVSLMAARLS
jgi:hypothetical protein